ncbi:MAG: hypothetical protein JSV51_04870 [Candidatus Bathyarchaeota archaeon]|nr:MAG: hypothetical protein JSV51_04870 [Candidatus Bathyarchaeota archaeon]
MSTSKGNKERSENEFQCTECGIVFETSQARGSHMKYKHGAKGRQSTSREGLDLKNAFVSLLQNVGVKRGAKTIAEIFLGAGGDSLENLDSILRLAGVSNPARNLVRRRWSQMIGKEFDEAFLKSESPAKRKLTDVFELSERMRETELQELMMEDFRSRIEERRRKNKTLEENALNEKIESLQQQIRDLRLSQTLSRQPELLLSPQFPPHTRDVYAYPCTDPWHGRQCVVCGNCGFHGSIEKIPIGGGFVCPRCQIDYFRDHD